MSLFDVVPSSVGFDVVEWFCFSYSSICVESFSLFRCVLVSMGFAFSYMSYLKLEFKFQITIPKFEGEGGHVYTVVVIYILKFEIWIQVSNKTLLDKADAIVVN